MANEIKTPLQKCRERNRVIRRRLFQWQEQAAIIGNMIGCSSVDIVEHIADLKAKCDAMKEALRELCEMLESQPSYESFHEYELSGTPDLCRRCGKYAGHAYHGRGLAKAQAAIKAMESEQPTGD